MRPAGRDREGVESHPAFAWFEWGGYNLAFCIKGVIRMAKVCEVCGKTPVFGNRVSHAHNVSSRRWLPNLQRVRAMIGGAVRRINVCTRCIRSGAVQKAAR